VDEQSALLYRDYAESVDANSSAPIGGTAFIGDGQSRDVTPYTLRKCLIFLGCDGVTLSLQYDRHAASNCTR
jgi:hypothetical protein